MKFRLLCFWSSSGASDDGCHPCTPSPQVFRVFSYKELKIATDDFRSSNKIGEGGFGSVYKGYLQDGTVVAVKVLSLELGSLQGEREFISEITALSEVKHENLVTLRGCCIHGPNRLLVYTYMENNSLSHSFLGGEEKRRAFGWEMRKNVSLGIAKGLAFLHEEAEPHIVHRDIKPGNIVLDRNFIPKISDFGLSKLFISNASHISTRVAGTLGYLAPEYAITGHLTRKSDVYSYGILLLQIVSGRSVMEFNTERGETYLADEAWDLYKENNILHLVDPTLSGRFLEKEAVLFLKVGLLCLQETATIRPQMSTVAKMLANEININDIAISKPGSLSALSNLKGHSTFSKSSSSRGSASYPTSI